MKDILQKIYDYSLEDIMEQSFGRYSKYIIQDRALPDVRDGLKPVQRRILYSMYKNKLFFESKEKKSAHVVGDVMGKYHPHGDSSIYDAMVRMSQSWKSSHPLITMRGNNGSIDGDQAAAQRYTEAKLSKISLELLKEIEKNTVTFSLTYDDENKEPIVLPSKFPNLLVSGSQGISAGYATNIPPHNLIEVIDATIKRINFPNCKLETIMEIIKGPDFPTGAIALGKGGIKTAYETGKGKILLRAKLETIKNKNIKQIIISEIPFEVNKANLCRKIDEIRIDKKIEGIIEVRDESDKETGYRIVVDIKGTCDDDIITNYLLKNTELQVSYNYNMVAIVNRRPKQLGLLDILDSYIIHQKEITTKSKEFDLFFFEERFHIVTGLIKALSILDEIIKTIRLSKNKTDAINNLVKEYGFSEKQATAIVLLQLYKLTNTDVDELESELEKLKIIIEELKKILSDETKLLDCIKHDLKRIKKEYGISRKTEIIDEIEEIKIDVKDTITKEDVIVVITHDGYIKRVSERSYLANNDLTGLKQGDNIISILNMNTLDTILLFTNLGNYLYLPVHEIPDLKWKDLGKHISNIIEISALEYLVDVIPIYDFNDNTILIFTKNGMVKRSKYEDFNVQRYSKPLCAIKLKENDEVISVVSEIGNEVFVATKGGYGLWYDLKEIPITKVRSSGVKSINLKNDEVVSGTIFNSNEEYISLFTNKGYIKRIKLKEMDKTSRSKRGLLILKQLKSNPMKVKKVFIVDSKNSVIIKTNDDDYVLKLTEISILDRYSIGSLINKKNINDVYLIKQLENKPKIKQEEVIEQKEIKEIQKEISLKEIDDIILTIDDNLYDYEDN